MSWISVARQPIFDLGRGLFGNELLYRRDASIDHADGDLGYMSAAVVVHARDLDSAGYTLALADFVTPTPRLRCSIWAPVVRIRS
jgi:hypothetical protein